MKSFTKVLLTSFLFLVGILMTNSCKKIDVTGTLIVKNIDTRFELSVAVYPYSPDSNLGEPLYQDTIKQGQGSVTYVLNPDNYIVYGGERSQVVQIHAGETVELMFDNN